MSRMTNLGSPLLLGFEEIERLLDRIAKTSGDGYPPYNIEKIAAQADAAETLRITLAVAGFTRNQLEITTEDNQLTIRGKQDEAKDPQQYLHRGIAARQFQKTFVLADGMVVQRAELENGLLSIDVVRPEQQRLIRRIEIGERG